MMVYTLPVIKAEYIGNLNSLKGRNFKIKKKTSVELRLTEGTLIKIRVNKYPAVLRLNTANTE